VAVDCVSTLPTARELHLRAARVREGLAACTLCEHRCGVDRLANGRGPCGLGAESHIFKRHVSFAEEVDLLPSYMVYFAGCNFRCRFCVQAPDCFDPRRGVRAEAGPVVADLRAKVARGARTINLLGGEPSIHLHTLLEIAAADAEACESGGMERLPLFLNSNMYMTPGVIEALRGVVTGYIADFKFGNDGCAATVAGISRYTEVVKRNLLDAASGARVIVRHLVMPGHLECCLRPVANWLAEHLSEADFTLMHGYSPSWRAVGDGTLGRCCTPREVEDAEAIVRSSGVRRSA